MGDKVSKVPDTFKGVVGVGVPQSGSVGALKETRLALYMGLLRDVRAEMQKQLQDNPDAGVNVVNIRLSNAIKEVDAILQPTDDLSRELLTPLFRDPLNVEGKIFRPTPK
jgi:type VI secretion system protein ImpL